MGKREGGFGWGRERGVSALLVFESLQFFLINTAAHETKLYDFFRNILGTIILVLW